MQGDNAHEEKNADLTTPPSAKSSDSLGASQPTKRVRWEMYQLSPQRLSELSQKQDL
jgi:hypothetical protein